MKKSELGAYLKEKGVMPSVQRLEIYAYLLGNKTHPSVDVIYKDLAEHIPSLSKTTVYNTLKLFVEKGIVIELNTDKSEARYDADVSKHGHFKCKLCSKIYDFEVPLTNLQLKDLDGFEVENYQLNLSGICKDCVQ